MFSVTFISFKKYISLLIIAAIVAAGIVIAPKQTYACDCAAAPDVLKHRDEHDAVFKGTVVSENKKKGKGIISSGGTYKITFDVSEVWRGKVTSSITVLSAFHEASCGFSFEEGKTYLVYAKLKDSDLHVSLCSRTASIDMASEDLSLLGSGSAPPELPLSQKAASSESNATLWILSIIMLMTLVVVVLIFRHNSRAKKF